MVYSLKGNGKTLEVYENKIVIRAGLAFGRSTKEIYLSSINGIQVKKPGLAVPGYIQFTVSGYSEMKKQPRPFSLDLADDENTVTFGSKAKYEEALIIKQKIESLKAKSSSISRPTVVMNQTSVADELRKLKTLLNEGVITQEEFNKIKNKLLGN